ncbi:MAG: polysaccharide biosynthesis protein [Clostridia bacterium]|nr:polysaccharide biosynthesis protein [Clostridia bacterium]
MAKNKGQTFVFGAIILMISNLAVKLIGAFLRIPLTNIIGVDGMAFYNSAYSIYVSFYMISTAGIPIAVSRMIATANSNNLHLEIKRIFKIAYSLFFTIGAVGTAVMMIFADKFARSAEIPDARLAMLAIAPTIFFICISSAYRGYFQGLQDMMPTAVSQVIEAVGKVGIGIFCAVYFTAKGYPVHVVAALVILGVTIGVFLGMVYTAVIKMMYNSSKEYKENLQNAVLEKQSCRSSKEILKELVIIAIPITLASSIMGLTNTVDTMIMPGALMTSGITQKAASAFYGTYSSMVIPLLNLAPPFIYPFAISAIPAISTALAKNDTRNINRHIESAFRNCAIIALPCAIGMGALSRRIVDFLFKEDEIVSGNTVYYARELAGPALRTVAVSIFFLGVISITNSVLQACKKEKYTIISTTSGIVVKIIATWFFSTIPGIGIIGSAIGTVLCYLTIMSLNLLFMEKTVGVFPNIRRVFLKPLTAGVCCGICAVAVSYALDALSIHAKLVTLLSIACAALVYVVVLIMLKGISRDDVLMMPKGDSLCRIMDKFHLLEKGEE